MIPLSETLLAFVDSLEPPEGSGLSITAATLDVPLEGWVAEGPVFLASVPHTRWVSGFLPPVSLAHIEFGDDEA